MKNAALAIVVEKDASNPNPLSQKILLVLRSDVPVWVLPGGGIEQGESPEVAVLRETLEESGLQVAPIDLVAIYEPINTLARPTYVFLCQSPRNPQPKTQDNDVIDARFFAISDLPKTLFPLHRTFINEWKSASALPIQRTLSEVTYWKLFSLLCRHPWLVIRYLWTRFTKSC